MGDAVDAIQRAALEIGMPTSIYASFEGTAGAFQDALANQPFLILSGLAVVHIVLGILYETFIHPVTILSTLPSAGVGALLAQLICRTDLSINAMIGIIMLVGLVVRKGMLRSFQEASTEGYHSANFQVPSGRIQQAKFHLGRTISCPRRPPALSAARIIHHVGWAR